MDFSFSFRQFYKKKKEETGAEAQSRSLYPIDAPLIDGLLLFSPISTKGTGRSFGAEKELNSQRVGTIKIFHFNKKTPIVNEI